MNRVLIFLFFALAPSVGAYGQSIELISETKETLFHRLTDAQRKERFDKVMEFWGKLLSGEVKQTAQERANSSLEILPDTLYAGEPIDAYYALQAEGPATCELYDLRGKRPKRVACEYLYPQPNDGPTRLAMRVHIDEPGRYELMVYYESERLCLEGTVFFKKSCQILEVHERK